MEQKEIEIKEQETLKTYKKHPTVAIILLIFGLICTIIAAGVSYQPSFEKVYSCLFTLGLLSYLMAYNNVYKLKGFCFIIYPIIIISTLIGSFTIKEAEKVRLLFTIISSTSIVIYFMQTCYDLLKNQATIGRIVVATVSTILAITATFFFKEQSQLVNLLIMIAGIIILAWELFEFIWIYKIKKSECLVKEVHETYEQDVEISEEFLDEDKKEEDK